MDVQKVMLETAPGVKVTKLGFLSHDGATQVKALMWAPINGKGTSPKAVIQLAHGMEEHIFRYIEFANYLAQQGFVVCGADMIGHGRSVASPERISCIPLAEGKDILIEDAHELRKTATARFSRKTPYFVFGHSMGSLLMRAYIASYGEGLSGAILSGTSQEPLAKISAANALAKMIARSKGEDYKSEFLESLVVGAFNKGIASPRTKLDWLCTDEAVVDAYIEDSWCGVPFSAGGHATLTDIAKEAASASCAAKVPKNLPLFFFSGALDPVGKCGAGVEKSAEMLRRAGLTRVDLKLYEGMRHEAINEPGKKQVFSDVVEWVESVLSEI
ncbi:MAG: lysophospholipase [Eggerthellaceae bacterium]|nr:lysophospholipase [Eggerthellaceae bacterium]